MPRPPSLSATAREIRRGPGRGERERRRDAAGVVEGAITVEVPELSGNRAVGVGGERRQGEGLPGDRRVRRVGERHGRRPVAHDDGLAEPQPTHRSPERTARCFAGRRSRRICSPDPHRVVARPVVVEIPGLAEDRPGRERDERDRLTRSAGSSARRRTLPRGARPRTPQGRPAPMPAAAGRRCSRVERRMGISTSAPSGHFPVRWARATLALRLPRHRVGSIKVFPCAPPRASWRRSVSRS